MASVEGCTNVKSHLPIPLFTGDTALTFKSISNKSYKQAKKLLCAARSLQNKDSPKDRLSMSEKLLEIYFENTEKKTVRNGSFMKCDYLEELVVQENLNYFIMKICPSQMFMYIKNQDTVKYFYCAVKEASDLLDYIDNEEIPTIISDIIMSCENWDLMYDYHCILHIQKYLCDDDSAQPVFSSFVLLKPTNQIMMCLNNKLVYDNINNNEISQELPKENQQSEIFFDVSGPLYLDVSPAILELILLLKIYQSPFGSTSIKSALSKRQVFVNKKFVRVNPFEKTLLEKLGKKSSHPSNSSREEYFQLTDSPFSYTDLKEDLHSSLVNRKLEITDSMYTSKTTTILVEVFELTSKKAFTANNNHKTKEEDKNFLSVFWRNFQFYSCLTVDRFTYDPHDPDDFIKLVGEREQLDRYILKVAEILSCRFNKPLHIQYKNMLQNEGESFFPRVVQDIRSNIECEFSKAGEFHTKDLTQKEERSSNNEIDDKLDKKVDLLEAVNKASEKDYEIMCDCQIEELKTKMPVALADSTERNDATDGMNKVITNSDESELQPEEMNTQETLTNGTERNGALDLTEKETINSDESDNKHTMENDSLTEDIKIDASLKSDNKCNMENDSLTEGIKTDALLKDSYLSHIMNNDSFRSLFSSSKETTNVQGSSASFIPEAFTVESDTVKSIFEAHPFEQGKRVAVNSTTETSDKRIEIYPSLKSEFVITVEDFMKDAFHDHSEDMKKLLKLISGYED